MHFWGAVLYCSFYKVKQFEIVYDNRIHEADKVTSMEFAKMSSLGKKGYSTRYGSWKKYDCAFYKMFLCFVLFFDIFHYFRIHVDNSLNMKLEEVSYGAQWTIFFVVSLHMQEYNSINREMLFNEDMNFCSR